nr:MAG TPA: hypothetical protein [Bacteriophage sp.]
MRLRRWLGKTLKTLSLCVTLFPRLAVVRPVQKVTLANAALKVTLARKAHKARRANKAYPAQRVTLVR